MPAPKGNKQGRQFKPGQSGNPDGRPKGYRAPTTIMREYLENNPDDAAEIVRVAMDKARGGDFQFFKYLCDRLDGMPSQSVNTNVTGGLTLTLSDEQKNRLDRLADMIAQQKP